MHKSSENGKLTIAIPVAATYRTAGAATGGTVDMAKFNNCAFIVNVAGATQWQGDLTCVVSEGTNSTQFSSAYIATLTIASATTDTAQSLEIRGEQMSAGYRYVRLIVTPAAGTGQLYSAVALQFNPRYLAP
jgi:hypothetical protein